MSWSTEEDGRERSVLASDRCAPTAAPDIPAELADFASRFEVVADDLTIIIERYDNHGRLLPDGAWCVGCWFTKGDVPNVHYLSSDGRWEYKHGTAFSTLTAAWEAFQAAGVPR